MNSLKNGRLGSPKELRCEELSNESLPRVTIANDLYVYGVAGLVLEQSLDELLIHPVVELAHPTRCQ